MQVAVCLTLYPCGGSQEPDGKVRIRPDIGRAAVAYDRTAMLNVLRPAVSRVLTPLGRALARRGVSPNVDHRRRHARHGRLGALYFFPRGELFVGRSPLPSSSSPTCSTGALARMTGEGSRWGAFLDSSLDRIGDAAIFSGLILHFFTDGQPVLAGVTLFCLVAGMLVSYVKARAEGLGMTCDVGLAERPERLVVVLLSALLGGLGVPYLPGGRAVAARRGERVHRGPAPAPCAASSGDTMKVNRGHAAAAGAGCGGLAAPPEGRGRAVRTAGESAVGSG